MTDIAARLRMRDKAWFAAPGDRLYTVEDALLDQDAAAEIERLQEALAEYGDHKYRCALKEGDACTCGYEAALKDKPQEEV